MTRIKIRRFQIDRVAIFGAFTFAAPGQMPRVLRHTRLATADLVREPPGCNPHIPAKRLSLPPASLSCHAPGPMQSKHCKRLAPACFALPSSDEFRRSPSLRTESAQYLEPFPTSR